MTDGGPETVALTAGMLIVVPKERWHRFEVPDEVTVLSATPQPTEQYDLQKVVSTFDTERNGERDSRPSPHAT